VGASDAVLTAAILVVVLLADGARRLPNDTLVLLRMGWGAWARARVTTLGSGISLVAWLIPVSLPVVLPPPGVDEPRLSSLRRARTRLAARTRRTRRALFFLRVVGIVMIAALVILMPYAVWARGKEGFVVTLFALLSLATLQAMLAYRALRRGGATRRDARRASVRLVWPFDAVRAAEIVQAQVVSGAPRFAVARELLGAQEFLHAFRPFIYDMSLEASRDDETALIREMFSAEMLASVIHEPPRDAPASAFCPRCATSYANSASECFDCGVALRNPRGR
jgi:hypothetical protein